MTRLDEYAPRYTRAQLRREGGVLEIKLHDGNGSSLVWDEPAHRELPDLFHDVGRDRDNHVVILTGAGESFCASSDSSGFTLPFTPETWDTIFTEGRQLIGNLLDIEVPMIAAINGPAIHHAEMAVLCDVVLATEDTILQDASHFPRGVPGDGVHTVWPTILGENRGRYFLITNQKLSAHDAERLGVVNEVLPREALLPRAWELARYLDTVSLLTLRYTRLALTQRLKRNVLPDLGFGLSMEGLAALGYTPS